MGFWSEGFPWPYSMRPQAEWNMNMALGALSSKKTDYAVTVVLYAVHTGGAKNKT